MKTKYDLRLLEQEARSLLYWIDGSGALMSARQTDGIKDEYRKFSLIMKSIYEIETFTMLQADNAMINILPPGCSVPYHWDNLTKRPQRWHLPIKTNPYSGAIWAGAFFNAPIGVWYGPVPYLFEHAIWNFGGEDRIHLVVDLI